MKHGFRTCVFVFAAVAATDLALARTAAAGQIELMTDPTRYSIHSVNIPGVGAYGAGEIGVRASNFTGMVPASQAAGVAAPQSLFQTFCMELDEYASTHNNANLDIEYNGPHYIFNWTLDSQVTRGGRNTDAGDPLSQQTQWLYNQFSRGTLAGYDYNFGAGRCQSGADLQMAIWYFENETGSFADGYSPSINPATTAFNSGTLSFINAANAAVAAGSSFNNVRVLNLTVLDDSGNVVHAQSMLVLVPLPETAWLGLGLMGIGVGYSLHRRRKARIPFDPIA